MKNTKSESYASETTFGALKIGQQFRVRSTKGGPCGLVETKITQGKSRFCQEGKMTDGVSRTPANRRVFVA